MFLWIQEYEESLVTDIPYRLGLEQSTQESLELKKTSVNNQVFSQVFEGDGMLQEILHHLICNFEKEVSQKTISDIFVVAWNTTSQCSLKMRDFAKVFEAEKKTQI